MNEIKIGLMGLNFFSGNLGCAALAYSFRSILEAAAEQADVNLRVTVFTKERNLDFERSCSSFITEEVCRYSFRSLSTIKDFARVASEQDCIFDFTEGDSFSDMYGAKRFGLDLYLKRVAEKRCARFVLGPQTYGPYESWLSGKLASGCIKRASSIYSRDKQSTDLVEELTGIKPKTTTDVALGLPYTRGNKLETAIGINVSGLLWHGGYTGDNQFGLKVDYRSYCRGIIRAFLDRGLDVRLIAHVFGNGDSPDEDYSVCTDLQSEYPECLVAPYFKTPIEAKSYISTLGGFTGARMHATIAAFSSGVPTVPFAYSKKFGGLFGSLGYDYVVDGRELNTNEAVELTTKYLLDDQSLQTAQNSALMIASSELDRFKSDITDLLVSVSAM